MVTAGFGLEVHTDNMCYFYHKRKEISVDIDQRCLRRILNIHWTERITNNEV